MSEETNVINRQGKGALRSTCTLDELASAINGLHLESIPPQNRWRALKERIAKVILTTTTDPAERAKPTFQNLQKAYYASKGIRIG